MEILTAPVSSIMTKDLITIGPEDPLTKVISIFKRERIHHLPVIDEGKVVGIVSKSDVHYFKKGFCHSEGEDSLPDDCRVKNIMTTGLAKMEPDDRIEVALEVFKENLFHAILVTEDNRLRGIVTTFDIIKAVSES
ncbi:CBS domain-containing protein [Membranihabitans maritimus]|uniref:CBS domain-containing protein n=1 Tax=Membranihabitans maritimus TaxID=2904244 RepID=UPI001F40F011|nr:CBS domain-containing protein [Membranihabitans maritimus]